MNAYFYQLVEGDINSTVGVGFNGNKMYSYPYALINSNNEMVIACVTEENAAMLLTNASYGACAVIKLAELPQEIMDCAKDKTFETLDEIEEFVTEGYKETTEYKMAHLEANLGLTFDVEKATLEEYQAYRQEENKTALAKYLKENPILWDDGKYYGVTQEDQIEMQTDLTAYNLKQQIGNIDWKLEWHDVKKSCREFILEEFTSLMNAIIDYVYPLRRLQEKYKELIYSCTDKDELSKLEFNYNMNEASE